MQIIPTSGNYHSLGSSQGASNVKVGGSHGPKTITAESAPTMLAYGQPRQSYGVKFVPLAIIGTTIFAFTPRGWEPCDFDKVLVPQAFLNVALEAQAQAKAAAKVAKVKAFITSQKPAKKKSCLLEF